MLNSNIRILEEFRVEIGKQYSENKELMKTIPFLHIFGEYSLQNLINKSSICNEIYFFFLISVVDTYFSIHIFTLLFRL